MTCVLCGRRLRFFRSFWGCGRPFCPVFRRKSTFFRLFLEKSREKIWWFRKVAVPLQPLSRKNRHHSGVSSDRHAILDRISANICSTREQETNRRFYCFRAGRETRRVLAAVTSYKTRQDGSPCAPLAPPYIIYVCVRYEASVPAVTHSKDILQWRV